MKSESDNPNIRINWFFQSIYNLYRILIHIAVYTRVILNLVNNFFYILYKTNFKMLNSIDWNMLFEDNEESCLSNLLKYN